MKKFLRIFITLVVIVGIVFGIRFLVNQNRSSDYLYVNLTSKQEKNEIRKLTGENHINELLEFINDSNNASKIDDSVKNSVGENGKLTCLRRIYADCDINFNEFLNYLCLDKGGDKATQDKVLSYYDKIVAQIKAQQDALTRTYNSTQNFASLNKVDFKGSFDRFVNEYQKTVNLYSKLCDELKNYVLDGVFNGFNANYRFVIFDISTKMNLFASENDNLLVEAKNLADNKFDIIFDEDYSIVNSYLGMSDANTFLMSEDKQAFIESKGENSKMYVTLNKIFEEVA